MSADGFTNRYSEAPLDSREWDEVDSAHRSMTPRFRAAYERTMGAVEKFCADKRQAIPVVRDEDEPPLTILRNAGLL